MRILLHGYFGFDNLGDEAILKALTMFLPPTLGKVELTAITNQPQKTQNALKINTVKRTLRSTLKAIGACDIFMLGGGGLLQDATSLKSLLYYLFLIYYAKKKGKKVILLAQGIGPLHSFVGKKLTKRVLDKVDLITVRDHQSQIELAKINLKNCQNIFVTADLVPLLFAASHDLAPAPFVAADSTPATKYLQIGIAPRRPQKNAHCLANQLARVADALIENLNAQVAFFPMQPQDIDFIKQIRANMKNPAKIEACTIKDIAVKLKNLNLMLSMRLHALIFSAMLGIKSLALSYDPKVEAFAKFMGMPCQTLSQLSVAAMLNDIQTLQKNSHTISEKISEKARILIRNARLNFEILKSFLNTYPRVTILGVALDNLSIFEAVDFVRNSIVERTPRQIITVNPELVYLATLDDSLKNLINSADLKTADGAGLLWAANYLKVPLKERVTGIDLMVRLLQLADQMRYRIFLLGSCEKIITQTTAAIQRQYPNLKLVGFQNGYFTDDAATVQKIKSSRPDILFVGMGAPKQDRWLAEHKNELGVPVCIGVGGSFDVVAGLKPRAPRWIQKMRAEWVYRLIKEPWRIKRQVNLFKFMWLVRKERKSQRSGI